LTGEVLILLSHLSKFIDIIVNEIIMIDKLKISIFTRKNGVAEFGYDLGRWGDEGIG
jgi:hypothetical protein